MSLETNKLFAKFLGWKYHQQSDIVKSPKWIDNYGQKQATLHEHLKFHNDWNWLMKIVLKIENETVNFNIRGNMCEIEHVLSEKESIIVLSESKIQAVYEACKQFIENERTT